MLSLADELVPMIREARVRRNGTVYAVPLDAWASALSMLADRPKNLALPLKSHGYLLEILANQAEKIAATAERDAEQHKRAGRTGAYTDPAKIGEHLANLKGATKT